MKKTAVQWLIDNLEKYEDYSKISYRCMGEIEIALEMEKEQLIDAASDHSYPTYELAKIDAEQYYNQTFKQD
jgi:hypothetical protein